MTKQRRENNKENYTVHDFNSSMPSPSITELELVEHDNLWAIDDSDDLVQLVPMHTNQ